MNNTIKKIDGFTIIEIMISMAISSMVIGGIYGVYTIQQRSYTVQEKVTELQQKIRSAMDFMASDIRMAGYDPKPPYDSTGVCDGARIQKAEKLSFSFDYCRVSKSTASSFSSQKISDTYEISNGNLTLQRVIGTPSSIPPSTLLAEGVDAIEFRYLDAVGAPISAPVAQTDTIRAVQVSMLVRASYPDPKYTDTLTYLPASQDTTWFNPNPANDHYHRRLLVTSIQLRNNI